MIWFVKQSNNGTGFIASPTPLPFADLRPLHGDRNREATGPRAGTREDERFAGMIPEGILHGSRESLEDQVSRVLSELQEDLEVVTAAAPRVAGHLVERAQGLLVQALVGFLDDCYLRVLIDVIRDGNGSNVRLRRTRTSLDPANYVPDDFPKNAEGEAWLTLSGLISDIWASFKFEPFTTKLEMLLKPLGYAADEAILFELRKQVAVRNAVQHHEGWLGPDLLRQLGRDKLPIAGPEGPDFLEPRTRIVLPAEEIFHFGETLRRFAEDLNAHGEHRIRARMYTRPETTIVS